MVGVRQGAVAVVVLCLSVGFAAAAHGAGEPEYGCKKIHRGTAQVDPNPSGRAPLTIGDSTMILPIPNLDAVGFSVNARGCRGFKESINIAARQKRKHQLPHLVLINAYGNGGVNPGLISRALDVLGRKRVLGLVTAYNADTGHPPAPDTDVLFKAARQYPHRIFVLDWSPTAAPTTRPSPRPAPGSYLTSSTPTTPAPPPTPSSWLRRCRSRPAAASHPCDWAARLAGSASSAAARRPLRR
jgi:hypothetical protein